MTDNSHGNRLRRPPREDTDPPTLRKVPAGSVPFGSDISRNGKYVYAAYDGEPLVAVGATAEEARRKWREIRRAGRR